MRAHLGGAETAVPEGEQSWSGIKTSGEEIRYPPMRFELVKAHFFEYLNTVLGTPQISLVLGVVRTSKACAEISVF